MESYLTGRGYKESTKELDSTFSPYGQSSKDSVAADQSPITTPTDLSSEVIFDEKDCPKVEVKSLDGKPSEIIVHLDDGRILCIQCQYPE